MLLEIEVRYSEEYDHLYVLILIVLEDALGVCQVQHSKSRRQVLILIVLEDALGVETKHSRRHARFVS